MPNVVLVVDMVRGFLEPGHNLYCGDDARTIIPNVRALMERETQAGSQVLFVSDHHDPDDLEFQIFPVHCVKGTPETEVIPELAHFVDGSNVDPQEPLQRLLQHRPGPAAGATKAGKAGGVRCVHRHLRHAHHVRRSQP